MTDEATFATLGTTPVITFQADWKNPLIRFQNLEAASGFDRKSLVVINGTYQSN